MLGRGVNAFMCFEDCYFHMTSYPILATESSISLPSEHGLRLTYLSSIYSLFETIWHLAEQGKLQVWMDNYLWMLTLVLAWCLILIYYCKGGKNTSMNFKKCGEPLAQLSFINKRSSFVRFVSGKTSLCYLEEGFSLGRHVTALPNWWRLRTIGKRPCHVQRKSSSLKEK